MTEVATQTIELPEGFAGYENKVLPGGGKRFTNNTWEFEAIQGAQKAKDPLQTRLDTMRKNQDIHAIHQRLNKMEKSIDHIKNLFEEIKMNNAELTLATEHQICKLERHFEGEINDLQGQIDSIQS